MQLPPFTTWGNEASALGDSMEEYWRLLQSSSPPPPLFLSLRLFPDSALAYQHGEQTGKRVPVTQLPLEAFLRDGGESPWGSALSSKDVFQSALRGVRSLAERLLPQAPLILVLPTRMLVSQRFVTELLTMLNNIGWRSVAIELPSTPLLYQPPSPLSQQQQQQKRGQTWDSWCRLPLVHADWATLQRTPSFEALRTDLTQDAVLPLHLLLPWAIEQGLLRSMDCGLVVDTVAPTAAHKPYVSWGCGNSNMEAVRSELSEMAAARKAAGEARDGGIHSSILSAVRRKGAQPRSVENSGVLSTADSLLRKKHVESAPRRSYAGELDLSVPSESLKQMILQSVNTSATGAQGGDALQDFEWLRKEMWSSTDGDDKHEKDDAFSRAATEVDEQEALLRSFNKNGEEDRFGKHYWQGVSEMEDRLNSRFTFTMPTYHAQQVVSWKETCQRGRPEGAPSPTFIPVLFPLLSAAELRAQQVLRESRKASSSTADEDDDGEGEGDVCRWLPRALDSSMCEQLASASSGSAEGEAKDAVSDGALQKVLKSYATHLRAQNEAAAEDDDDTDENEEGAEKEAEQHSGNSSSPTPTLRGLTKANPRARPFWYEPPQYLSQKAKARSDEFIQKEVKPAMVRLVSSAAGADGVAGLSVPPPGLSDDVVRASWQCLF